MGIRQRSRLLVVVTILAILALTGEQAVSAHAQLKTSDPADKAIVGKPPAQVAITFSQETNPTKSGGSVTDASGATVSTGFKVDLNDRTKMTVDLKPNLPNGAYTVKWNSFTDDDNGVANGTFSFTIQAAAAGTGTPAGSPPSGSAAAGSAPAASAPALPPAPTPSATVAPTATRAATTAAATGTGGGTASASTATRPPTTLPQTGYGGAGNGTPWVFWIALIGTFALAAGFAVRARSTRSRR